ncbi:MAG: GTP 3',8-cyclase MoaA [Phycisphaerales bacterium]|nr:MAG: GTP 3',8-cyclase MoaA [Phycisphaerales bacterium]
MDVDYLRVSVTDRCNLRCVYCNPPGGHAVMERGELLSFEEIQRLVRLCAECGIRRVRLTGGEPLVREDIADLVRGLAGIPGIEEVSLTTNGVLLGGMAGRLREAGLRRVNISIDSAERRCYERITGSDLLGQVLEGMHQAIEAGLNPVKINCVVIREVNLAQVAELARMGMELGVLVRFIEYCPVGKYVGPAGHYVPNSEVRRIIEARFGRLSSVVAADSQGPAVHFKARGWAGAIGFISGRSSIFCHRCNRLRLRSDGKIKPCLHSARCYDLRRLLRHGASDQGILEQLRRILREKSRYTKLSASAGDLSMQNIGG